MRGRDAGPGSAREADGGGAAAPPVRAHPRRSVARGVARPEPGRRGKPEGGVQARAGGGRGRGRGVGCRCRGRWILDEHGKFTEGVRRKGSAGSRARRGRRRESRPVHRRRRPQSSPLGSLLEDADGPGDSPPEREPSSAPVESPRRARAASSRRGPIRRAPTPRPGEPRRRERKRPGSSGAQAPSRGGGGGEVSGAGRSAGGIRGGGASASQGFGVRGSFRKRRRRDGRGRGRGRGRC